MSLIEHADAASALLAARAQFAITIGLHIVLAAFSIGLAQWLMALEAWWLWRRQPAVLALYRYWLKVFALTVAAGTASGLVMEYQFGLNWARLSLAVGEIIGPLMLYEVLVAFFLEAGFLGVMLFGQNKVGPKLHFSRPARWPVHWRWCWVTHGWVPAGCTGDAKARCNVGRPVRPRCSAALPWRRWLVCWR